MTTPVEIQTQVVNIISPISDHHERFDDEEEPTPRELALADEIDEEVMIHMVTEALRSTNEKTLEQALLTLKKFIYGKDSMSSEEKKKRREAFCQVGGHLAVVRVVREHYNSNSIQVHGINVLWGAAFNNASCQTAVAKVKSIQAILAAMDRFSSDFGVVSNGFGALRDIVLDHQVNADILATKVRGFPVIVGAMTEFRTNQDVVRRACQLLKHLAEFEQLRKSLVDAKILIALAHVIDDLKGNDEIQDIARQTMKLLV